MNDLAKDRYRDIHIDLILYHFKAAGAKSALQLLAKEASKHSKISLDEILASVQQDQILATAAIGNGVAFPNIKVANATKAYTILARLDKPVKFKNAPDNEPVDIICLLISPEADGPVHLRRMARLSRLVLKRDMRQKIRAAQNEDALRMVVDKTDGWLVAA